MLLRLAVAGLIQARWSDEILDECFEHILANRPDIDPGRIKRTRDLMNLAIPDAFVTGYEDLVPGLRLPDANDRHVLAAAIRAGASVILTENLRDFPVAALSPHGIVAVHPDGIVCGLINLDSGRVLQVVSEQAAALRNPPRTLLELLDTLEKAGLKKSVGRLRSAAGGGR